MLHDLLDGDAIQVELELEPMRLARDDAPYLELGPGYRLLRTSHCGICSTDLARHRLPFALPQVTGHEIVARETERMPASSA